MFEYPCNSLEWLTLFSCLLVCLFLCFVCLCVCSYFCGNHSGKNITKCHKLPILFTVFTFLLYILKVFTRICWLAQFQVKKLLNVCKKASLPSLLAFKSTHISCPHRRAYESNTFDHARLHHKPKLDQAFVRASHCVHYWKRRAYKMAQIHTLAWVLVSNLFILTFGFEIVCI